MNKFVVDLDEMGSFIWKHIDGKNIYEISLLLKDEFKKKLNHYMKGLYSI